MARNLKKDYIKKILSMEAPNGYKFDIANYPPMGMTIPHFKRLSRRRRTPRLSAASTT